ncbi:MAG: hypothetical protein KDA24_27945 [Deltaproteobacteria bacterium]|nr:hypothetical protein [Deltaproteobacteria bacterium]
MSLTAQTLRRALAALMALGLTLAVAESGHHALEALHVVCDTHGVVEHLGDAAHEHSEDHGPQLTVDTPASADGHDACGQLLGAEEPQVALKAPAATTALLPLPRPDTRHVAAPVQLSDAPRGPPLLRLAAKTSPPQA